MAKFVIYSDTAGEFRWHLKANNGEIIADSAEGFTRRETVKESVRLVKTLAPRAEVEDKTLVSLHGW